MALLLLLAGGAGPAAAAQGDPAVSTPRPAPYDAVGYAVIAPDDVAIASHPTLPVGSYAEVTALDSGRTVLIAVAATTPPGAGREIVLPKAVALELGLGADRPAPVRVRAAAATPGDIAAFAGGRIAVSRTDAPPALLVPLRRKLGSPPPPAKAAAPAPKAKPVAAPTSKAAAAPQRPPSASAPPAPASKGPGYYVQVAALSDPARAASLARSVGGSVSSAGRFHRVRLGPFVDQRKAQAARDAVAGRGYGDARIIRE